MSQKGHLVLMLYLMGLSVQAFVANPDRCAQCHHEQFQFWQGTYHSSAYLVLFSKNSHADPDCVRCHTLGLNKPGGFMKIISPLELAAPPKGCAMGNALLECFLGPVFGTGPLTPLDSRNDSAHFLAVRKFYHERRNAIQGLVLKDYMNVQCEHCHGNREAHARQEKKLGVKIAEKVTETTCRGCHTTERDPDFTVKKISKVSCPKMKRR